MLVRWLARNIVVNRKIRETTFRWSGYNKYGLKQDDCLEETPAVQEALRRLPLKLLDERNYRCVRAIQLSINHEHLPKDQWLTLEEDDHYLQPIVNQVIDEMAEVQNWERDH